MKKNYPWMDWCIDSIGPVQNVTPLQSEASARHYYRLSVGQGAVILMDASAIQLALKNHLQLTRPLEAAGIRVPRVFASDCARGWLLLEDFGSTTLCQQYQSGAEASVLLRQAVDTLLEWQEWGGRYAEASALTAFSETTFQRKLRLFQDNFLVDNNTGALQNACEKMYQRLLSEAKKQPSLVIHRDYHSRNLMCLPDGLGVIDFQDAMRGPIAYDLVSLLKDAYLDWPEAECEAMQRYFYESSEVTLSYDEFVCGFDWLGIGRHLKCLGLFTRLSQETGKEHYRSYIPRLLHYLLQMAERYSELFILKPIFTDYLESSACKP